jgi:hypothetical protein
MKPSHEQNLELESALDSDTHCRLHSPLLLPHRRVAWEHGVLDRILEFQEFHPRMFCKKRHL